MRFYVIKARSLLLWMIGAMMILLGLGIGAGRLIGRQEAAAPALAQTAREEEAPAPHFTLEVIAVTSPGKTARSVFLYHTHTHEAYEMDPENRYVPTETWRTADENCNVVRVGEELAECLRRAGIQVHHDTADYEMPKLSTAYSRSLQALKTAAEEGYDLYIDLHRDSFSKGNGPNTVTVEEKEAARLLFLIGQGTGTGFDERPDWPSNARAAQAISDFVNSRTPDLSRGIALKSGRYNQQAATPSMLIEVGNNKNTLPEALCAMEPLARAICQYFDTLE